jgi:hypothetical protein
VTGSGFVAAAAAVGYPRDSGWRAWKRVVEYIKGRAYTKDELQKVYVTWGQLDGLQAHEQKPFRGMRDKQWWLIQRTAARLTADLRRRDYI